MPNSLVSAPLSFTFSTTDNSFTCIVLYCDAVNSSSSAFIPTFEVRYDVSERRVLCLAIRCMHLQPLQPNVSAILPCYHLNIFGDFQAYFLANVNAAFALSVCIRLSMQHLHLLIGQVVF